MQGFNKVFLLGRLGYTPEIRTAKSGENYTRLRIATKRRMHHEDGTDGEVSDWYSVHVWGKQADHCAKYLQKGQGVMIEGYLSPYDTANESGEKEKRLGITALKVQFLPTVSGPSAGAAFASDSMGQGPNT